jgi:hypothetical protein
MNIVEITRLFDAKPTGNNQNQYIARCPAHDDKTPSLSIGIGTDGRTLIKCLAGCSTEAVLAAKGLKLSDLFLEKQNPVETPPPQKKLVAIYDYVGSDGNLLFQKLRYEPKTFMQRRPDPDNIGQFLWNMNGTLRVIYRLPQVLTAIKEGKQIFLCEGEKAVHAAESIGLVATCSPDGAGKWRDSYSDSLKTAVIIVLPDNDEPGHKHVSIVEKSLKNIAKSVRILELPGLPEKGDIHDFIEARDAQEPQAIKDEILNLIPPIPPPKQHEPSQNIEEFYYEKYSKEYLLRNKRKSWMALTETQFRKELAYRGMNTRTQKGENISEADEFIIKLRDTRDIDYAGPLAGYKSGFYEINGNRVLVTESPKIITPAFGEWKTIESLIQGLLYDEKYDQPKFLYGWLKIAYESVSSGKLRPGQALAICGPHNCGKSLLQLLITKIIGGRSEKPYSFMTASTDFNGDLFKAEHLCIEDEPANTDLRVRRAFGSQIKQIAGSDTQRCHEKHKQAIVLTPFWRLTISLNDEPENLMVLPPIDNSMEDKLMIFKASNFEMPMQSKTNDERIAFWKQLESELPAFLYYLCQWQIPENIRQSKESQRYGIDKMHHINILREIDALSPEFRLLSIIDKEIFGEPIPTTWIGTSEDLEVKLTSNGDMQHESRKLLSWGNATGTYLGRLAKKFPGRFTQKHTERSRIWTIEPPAFDVPLADG